MGAGRRAELGGAERVVRRQVLQQPGMQAAVPGRLQSRAQALTGPTRRHRPRCAVLCHLPLPPAGCNIQDELFASFENLIALADKRGSSYDRCAERAQMGAGALLPNCTATLAAKTLIEALRLTFSVFSLPMQNHPGELWRGGAAEHPGCLQRGHRPGQPHYEAHLPGHHGDGGESQGMTNGHG